MSRRRPAALLPLLLVAGCAALGWKIYDDWSAATADAAAAPSDTEASAAAPEASTAAPADLALSLPPPERFAVIVERPLFSPTRRPAPPAAEQAQAEEPAPELAPAEPDAVQEAAPPPAVDFTLVGIVIAGAERYALVERHADGQVVEVAEGGDVGGWFAVLIDPDRAVFRQGAVEEELVLKYESPVPPERIPPPRAVPPPAEPAPAEPVQPTAPPE